MYIGYLLTYRSRHTSASSVYLTVIRANSTGRASHPKEGSQREAEEAALHYANYNLAVYTTEHSATTQLAIAKRDAIFSPEETEVTNRVARQVARQDAHFIRQN